MSPEKLVFVKENGKPWTIKSNPTHDTPCAILCVFFLKKRGKSENTNTANEHKFRNFLQEHIYYKDKIKNIQTTASTGENVK
jgi:1-deoxy-D-xylulose 5-phosphate reductoisomerase